MHSRYSRSLILRSPVLYSFLIALLAAFPWDLALQHIAPLIPALPSVPLQPTAFTWPARIPPSQLRPTPISTSQSRYRPTARPISRPQASPTIQPVAQAIQPAAPPIAPANLHVSIQKTYYDITGSTSTELINQMSQLGPVWDRTGQRQSAMTYEAINWNYIYQFDSQACAIQSLDVTANIQIIYPRWNRPSYASQIMINGWRNYSTALEIHEQGHKDIAVTTADQIMQAIRALPPYPTCAELHQAINTTGHTILNLGRQRQIDYDYATNHGETQGTWLP